MTPPAAPRRRDPLVVVAVVASAIAVVLLFVLAGVAAWVLLTPRDGAGRAAGNEDPTSSAVVKDYRDREDLLSPDHATGEIDYEINPPVGGRHNDIWQNCQGDIYDKPIADEHAVHSLEHGAIWITYRPGLKQSEIDKLAQRVRDRDFMMMSPHKALDRPISLQAWGLQLKTDRADDPAIDQFIKEHRVTAALEPGAPCSGGTTKTGDRPEDGD